MSERYKAAGVDIDLAQNLLSKVKGKIAATKRPEMLAPIGGFGGLFQVDLTRYKQPILVSSVDGVGTKLMVAMMMDKHDSVGHDIVNHCINDIAVQGAEPVYFMDYIGIGKLRSPLYEEVLEGIADACAAQNVAVLGGETAEMPGMYGNDYDLVGCITGMVEKADIITGENINAGDIVIGLASNGLHTNGYSLARTVLFEQAGYDVYSTPDELGGESVGEALLKPHTCYWPALKDALANGIAINGIAHITGGGVYDNIPRVLPKNVNISIDASVLPIPPIFSLICKKGELEAREAYRVFNMGIGMVVIVAPNEADAMLKHCTNNNFTAAVIGKICEGDGTVIVENS